MTQEKLQTSEVMRFIRSYHKRFGTTPTISFLEFIYKVSRPTIIYKIKELVDLGKLRPVKKKKYIIDYELIK